MSAFAHNTRTNRVEGSTFTTSFFSSVKNGVMELVDGDPATAVFHPAGRPVFSAERIQRAVAIFESRPVIPSSDVSSWKSLTWVETVPAGTSVYAYVRTAATEAKLEARPWSGPFVNGNGDLAGEVGRLLQFRLAMTSSYDPGTQTMATPLVTSATAACYVRGASQMFYTKSFGLSFLPRHIVLTYNGAIPADAIVQFAVSTGDSTDSANYQVISANTVVNIENVARENSIRIAVSAIGNTEIPFVIDEFAVAVGGDGFDRIS